MDVESVKSGRSDRSRHSQPASNRNAIRRPHSSSSGHQQHRSGQLGRTSGRPVDPLLRYGGMESDTDRDDRSSKISRRYKHSLASDYPPPESSRDKMAMRAYDDQFDNFTVVTGATSEFGYSLIDVRGELPGNGGSKSANFSGRSFCSKFVSFCGTLLVFLLCLASFLSPLAMVILPRIPSLYWDVIYCDPECESALLGIGFKLLILLIATWALFFRAGRAALPRLDPSRGIVVCVTFLLTFSFWLFYGVRLFQKDDVAYLAVVSFASSLVDCLLFVHYLAVVLLELRRLQNRFAVKIVRSPDGASRTYAVGQMTVQNLAVWCLDKYYTDFQSYNPYLEILPKKTSGGGPAFKLYNVDSNQGCVNSDKPGGGNGSGSNGGGRTFSVTSSSVAGGRPGHNERFYGEQEYERRVMRRKSRLQSATEEAFAHLKKIRVNPGSRGGPMMTSREAAQAIFPTLVRPLQKYLRVTRQQPKYTMENVLNHLAICISFEMSSKAFLDRYLTQGEVVWTESGWSKLKLTPCKGGEVGAAATCTLDDDPSKKTKKHAPHSWVISCEKLLSRTVDEGCILKLSRGGGAGGETLVVTFKRLPFFDVVEQPLDLKCERFVLDMNAELTV